MGKIRSVTMRFDLSYPADGLTYSRLKHTSDQAGRRGRGRQAEYLLSILLGGREFQGLRDTGLEEWPDYTGSPLDPLEYRIEQLEKSLGILKQPCLRLVPMSQPSTSEPRTLREGATETPDVSA
jgi:hypothetical protein